MPRSVTGLPHILRDLLLVATGFTLGRSLTLALAVTGILRPDGQCIDALVALTIALIGARRSSVTQRISRSRWRWAWE